MAIDNTSIYTDLYQVSEILKDRYRTNLIDGSTYDENANIDFHGSKKKKTKFGKDTNAGAKSNKSLKSNRAVIENEFIDSITQYNNIMDEAVKELAVSIDNHSKKVTEHIQDAIDNTPINKEEAKAEWSRKYTGMKFGIENYRDNPNVVKTLNDRIVESIANNVDTSNHKLDSNANTLEDFRYSILKQLKNEGTYNDSYETWDFNEEFIRDELIKGNPGEYKSEFLSDEFITKLNNSSIINIEQQTDFKKYIDEQLRVKNDEKEHLNRILATGTGSEIIPPDDMEIRTQEYEKSFQEYIAHKQRKQEELISRQNDAVKDLDKNKQKELLARNELTKSKAIAEKKIELLKTATEIESNKNKINFELEQATIDEILEKANTNLAEAIAKVESSHNVIDSLKTRIKDVDELLQAPTEIKKADFHKELSTKIKDIDTTIALIKEDDKAMAGFVSDNVRKFWDNQDIEFKSFTPEQFETALESIEDDTTRDILSKIYDLDDTTNTYKKSPYLLWDGDESLGIKGVTDITDEPSKIVKYFNLSDHGNKTMDEYYGGSIVDKKNRAELEEISDKLRKVKNQQKDMTLDERISAFRDLHESLNNASSIQSEVQSEMETVMAQPFGTNADGTAMVDEVIDNTIVSNKGEATQFKWVSEKEAELLGDKTISKLRGTELGQELFEISKKKIPVTTDIDFNKEYIDVINKALNNEDLDFNKSKLRTGLESINVLNKIDDLFSEGTTRSIAQGKQALASYAENRGFAASGTVRHEMEKLGLYGSVKDVNDVPSLRSIIDNTIGGVVKYLDDVDWDLINTIKDKTEYVEKPEIIQHFQESLSENRREKIEIDRNLNGGIEHDDKPLVNEVDGKIVRTIGDQYENEEDNWRKEIQKASNEYDATNRDFMLRDAALEEAKEEEISVIQKRQAEFVNGYIKKTNIPVNVSNLGRNFTLEELNQGYIESILDKNNKPVPIQHFSEFYSMMSISELDKSRDKNKPFTKEEWNNKAMIIDNVPYDNESVIIGDNAYKVNQFYEYYNEDIRKAQNDEIRADITAHNNDVQSQMEERKMAMREQNERMNADISTDKVDKAELERMQKLSDMEIEREYSGRMIKADISDELSNNDVESFYKYKQNDYLAATRKNRTMYIPKGADPEVLQVLNKVKNSNNKAIHFDGDVLHYDVVSINKDSFKVKPVDWLEANKTKFSFKFSEGFMETMKKANELEFEMKGYGNKNKEDYVTPRNAISEGKLIINDTVYPKQEIYNKMTKNTAYIELPTQYGAKKIPIQKSALKVIDTNFTWMRKDPLMAGSLAADAEMSVLEAIADVTDKEVNEVFVANKDAVAKGTRNIVDITEEAITNRLKGNLLRNYINSTTGDSGNAVVRGAKIALEADNKPINVETVSDFLRTVLGPTTHNDELSKYYNDIEKTLHDKEYLKQLIESDITNIVPKQEIFRRVDLDNDANFDINDDDSRRKLYGEKLSEDDYQIESKLYKASPTSNAVETHNQLIEKRSNLAKTKVKEQYGYTAEEFFNTVKQKYTQGIATIKVDNEIKNNKGKKGKKILSKTSRKKLIAHKQGIELGKLNSKINNKYKEIGLKEMISISKELEHSKNGTMQSVLDYVSKNPRMINIAKDFDGLDPINIMKKLNKIETNLATKDTGVKLQAISEHVRKNGTDSLIEYFDALSDDKTPFSGIAKLFSNSEIVDLSNQLDIGSLHDYEGLALLADITPGLDIEVQGVTAKGQTVSFNIGDAKPNYEGGSGLIVRDMEQGNWIPVVDVSPKSGKPVGLEEVRSLASTERSTLDVVKKLKMQNIEQPPIFINSTTLKTTIAPNLNFDFENVATVGGVYGNLSPVQSLVNTTKLLDDALTNGHMKAVTIDYETTGLPDKLRAEGNEHLFQPVQATIETFDIGHTGEKFETITGGIANHYLAPTAEVKSHMAGLYGEENISKLIENFDGNDVHMLKNYAKYNMSEAGYTAEIIPNAEGIDKVNFLQEVTGADGKVTQQFVESEYTPESYVKALQENADSVTKFLDTFGEIGEAKHIDLDTALIHEDKVDFMMDIIGNTREKGQPLVSIGHNMSGAEMPWTKRWLGEAKESVKSQLDTAIQYKDSVGVTVNKKVLKELNKPFLTENIDTMHLGKIIEPGEAKFNLIDSANRNDVSVDGAAHLAEVDVPKTTQLFTHYANTDKMRDIRKGVNSAIEVGDVIVKSGKRSEGLQLDRGIYKISGFTENKDGGTTMSLLDLGNDNKPIDIKVHNVASLQKDAMETWTKFRDDDIDVAMKLNNDLEAIEANRTMKNGMTNLDTWMLHKQTGQDGGYGKMLGNFNSLKTKFDALGIKADNNLQTETVNIDGVEVPSMSYKSYTDEEKFLYENRGKFQGKGYVKELNRLSSVVPDRRVNANKLEVNYMNSDEGKMVENFLVESQNRLDAGVIDKKTFKAFNEGMRQTIHDVKLEAFQNGKMDNAMIIAPKKYNVGEINVDVLADKSLGGSAHGFGVDGLSVLKPFDFTLDFTNSKTLSDSVWGAAGKLANNMQYNKQVSSIKEGRTVALNRYVMPLLQQKGLIPSDGDWANITNIAKNVIATDDKKINIPDNMARTLPLAVNHMMDNKQAVTAKLVPLQEVNMMQSSSGEVLSTIHSKLTSQLATLDKEAATRMDGDVPVFKPELDAINKELIKIESINKQDAIKATGGSYMPFYNYTIGSSNATSYIENLPNVTEFNVKNPVTPELGMMTAEQIKTKADSLVTDRELLRPYQFRNMALGGNAERAVKIMPEYMEVLKNDYGKDMGRIGDINNDIAKDLDHRVRKPLASAQSQAKSEKADMYKELYRRASERSKYDIHGADTRQLTLDNIDKTKFNSMLQLGWAQKYQDANGVERIKAGKVGMPGQASTSELLDPSKVLITSRAKVGSLGPNGAVGLSYTDLNLSQLDALSKSKYTPSREKIMIDSYIKQEGIQEAHTNTMAQQRLKETLARKRVEQSQPVAVSDITPEARANTPDYIGGINENTINNQTRTPLVNAEVPVTSNARSNVNATNVANTHNTHTNINTNNVVHTVDDVIPESHITRASVEFRNSVKEVGGEARQIVGEMMNSKAAVVLGVGLAFAGAMALTRKQYTGDGGTSDQKANGDTAPRVDGTYAPEYNGSKHANIPIPKQQKTVRVEENGTGMNVNVRAKNKGNVPDSDVQNAVSSAVNGTSQANINIHQTDDRQSIDKGYVSNLFSQLLGGQ